MNRITINGNSIQVSGNNVSSHTIDTSQVNQSANDELVDRLLIEYANKPSGNVEVKGV